MRRKLDTNNVAVRYGNPGNQNSDKVQKRSDCGGLFLFVSPTGSKLWRLSYRFDGKQKLLSFGAYPSVSLVDARRKKDEAKSLLAKGIAPKGYQFMTIKPCKSFLGV